MPPMLSNDKKTEQLQRHFLIPDEIAVCASKLSWN